MFCCLAATFVNMHYSIRKALSLCLILIFGKGSSAQTTETAGWFFLSHAQELNKKWSYITDVQLRSSAGFAHVQNILFRPGLLYNLTDNQTVGIGYTFFGTWDRNEMPHTFEPEHRIFEQYIVDIEKGRLALSNRFRLEQRFIQQSSGNVFAQRFRHQVQLKVRLATDSAFNKGSFLKLQNEVFLNIQNKQHLNGNFFDQTRPYAALGYRFTKKLEAELGWYYRVQLEADGTKKESIVQLLITTDL